MADNFLVVGLGTFGRHVARTLFEGGVPILAVDRDEARVNAVREECSMGICCDATDAAAMQAIGAFDVDTAIVAIRNHFDVTVLVTHSLRKHGVARILVQVDSELEGEAIRAVGATGTVFPQHDMALRIAHRLLHPDLAERIPLGRNVAMIDIPCPPLFVNQTIGGLALRTRYGANLIGIRHPEGTFSGQDEIQINPPPDTRLKEGSGLILLGTLEQLAGIKAIKG